jgi:hypothetical protein
LYPFYNIINLRKEGKTTEGENMKKVFFFVLVCGLCVTVFAQVTETGTKPESTTPASPAMDALQTAYALAQYGYANSSASALIGAAEILARTQTQDMNKPGEQTGQAEDAASKAEKPQYTAANLLADGRRLAGRDNTMLAWAKKVEDALKIQTKGAVGGPRRQIDRVAALSTITYRVDFRANELAEIVVIGDGDTDLDLYVYDANGNLVTYDEDYTDRCYVSFVPRFTLPFIIRVVNRGRVYNQFVIATN